ncbi:hypothetical protein ACJ72_00537 [Emergomyces africanus]|uniref:RRM domain-containing protein n=1 Tax=Emergomyces africanus TaxID=1955775 RepID=A0A1B7P7X3_9EURO|nr:hypothetical protein ACJ72_00537 [Emergomyces africanus]
MTSTGTTRLHISPLTPDLLNSIIRLAAVDPVTDISYHSVQTFPENSYGFVNLPKMEAEKVVKKLNGTILKGKKLKIHEARPSKRPPPSDSEAPLAAASTSPRPKPEKSLKKRKSTTDNIVDGYELPPERHVKRGWTEPAGHLKRSRKADKKEASRKSQRSKYTETPECLFRKKSPEKKKKKEKKDGKVVVHEFENLTTIPNFLRTGEKPREECLTSEYVDGKGWVDRAGNVKEKPVVKDRHKTKQLPIESKMSRDNNKGSKHMAEKVVPQPPVSEEVGSDETSSSGSSSESSSEEEDSDANDGGEADDALSFAASSAGNDSASSSSSSGDEEDEEKVQSSADFRVEQRNHAKPSVLITPNKNQTSPIITRKERSPAQNSKLVAQSAASGVEVHPLEALFKRPAKRRGSNNLKQPLEINTQFSFFGVDDDGIEEVDDQTSTTVENPHSHLSLTTGEPQTPFTKRDLMSRTVRSAAPTPDTAAPHKTRFWPEYEENGDDQGDVHDGMDDEDEDEDIQFPRINDDMVTPSKLAGTVNTAAAGEKKEGEGRATFRTHTSFCKCTCFSNSTIIQLGPPKTNSASSAAARSFFFPRDENNGDGEKKKDSTKGDKEYRALNCNDCNRRFCLDYGLPKCKGAKEEDVFTTCFQRDSNKDKAVVFIFIIATAGLLVWAAIKPWVEKWILVIRERRSYLPVSGQDH